MVKGILFDKDGCLLDFNATWGQWCFDLLTELAQGDAGSFEKLADVVGFRPSSLSFDPSSAVIAGMPEDGVNLLLPHLPNWTFDNLLALSNARAKTAPIVPVVPLGPLLDELRDMGISLGVATNDAEGSARAHMTGLGVADRFELILGSDSGHGGKPEPGMQHAFSKACDIQPSECIMVGDSLHDLHAGRAAGMICVGVLTGPAPRDELEPHAEIVLPDIGHLPGWISRTAKNDA